MLYFAKTILMWVLLSIASVSFLGQFLATEHSADLVFIKRIEAEADVRADRPHSEEMPVNILGFINRASIKNGIRGVMVERNPYTELLILPTDGGKIEFDGRLWIAGEGGNPIEIINIEKAPPGALLVLTEWNGKALSYGRARQNGFVELYGTESRLGDNMVWIVTEMIADFPRYLAAVFAVAADVVGGEEAANSLRGYVDNAYERRDRMAKTDYPELAMAHINGRGREIMRATEIFMPLLLAAYALVWLLYTAQKRRNRGSSK